MSVRLVTTKPRKPKRYYGEEAVRLTDAEQKVVDERNARIAAGTFDWSSVLVEAPKHVLAIVVPE